MRRKGAAYAKTKLPKTGQSSAEIQLRRGDSPRAGRPASQKFPPDHDRAGRPLCINQPRSSASRITAPVIGFFRQMRTCCECIVRGRLQRAEHEQRRQCRRDAEMQIRSPLAVRLARIRSIECASSEVLIIKRAFRVPVWRCTFSSCEKPPE